MHRIPVFAVNKEEAACSGAERRWLGVISGWWLLPAFWGGAAIGYMTAALMFVSREQDGGEGGA